MTQTHIRLLLFFVCAGIASAQIVIYTDSAAWQAASSAASSGVTTIAFTTATRAAAD
jgi:hypothetical protein